MDGIYWGVEILSYRVALTVCGVRESANGRDVARGLRVFYIHRESGTQSRAYCARDYRNV